jgi:hypothetical protein
LQVAPTPVQSECLRLRATVQPRPRQSRLDAGVSSVAAAPQGLRYWTTRTGGRLVTRSLPGPHRRGPEPVADWCRARATCPRPVAEVAPLVCVAATYAALASTRFDKACETIVRIEAEAPRASDVTATGSGVLISPHRSDLSGSACGVDASKGIAPVLQVAAWKMRVGREASFWSSHYEAARLSIARRWGAA